jgi:serine/threonine-protein kinase
MPPPPADQTTTPGTGPLPEKIGRYVILGRLGAGGMGTVYKAQDPHLDRTVALKVPRIDTPSQDRAKRVERFQREARSAAQVWHPHVCPIYDVGEHEGQPYVVMAFVQGQSLAQRLARQGRFEDVGEALALTGQVLDALAAVHGHGIVHRDLKPSNILLDAAGRAVLTDFGLARPEQEAERLTSEGVLVGTPAYMAPEQAAGQSERVGPWTDLYSVGVVLFEMLTGRLPFEGAALAVLGKIVHEPAPPLSRLRPYLDPRLQAVLLKALDKDPQGRFQTAGQFRDALVALAEPAPTASLAPTPPPGEGRERLAVPKATRVDEYRRDLGNVLLDVLPVALFALAGVCLLIDLLTESEERGRKAQLAMFCLLILGGALTFFGILRRSGWYKELVPNPGGPDEYRTNQGKMFLDGLALGLFALAGCCLVKYALSTPGDSVSRGDVQAAMLVLVALGSVVVAFDLLGGRFRART